MAKSFDTNAALAKLDVLWEELRLVDLENANPADVLDRIEALQHQILDAYKQEDDTNAAAQPGLSPSLMPHKCSTAPEICVWANSCHFREECLKIGRAFLRGRYSNDAIRRMASINNAYDKGYYTVSTPEDYDYPPGATGAIKRQPKLPLGSKRLKRNWDEGVPADEDVYVPQGTNRKLENRPSDGRWFYPRPSLLRSEYASD